MVIPRDDVETYIRKCAWQGMDDKALQKEWDNLSIFCIYLENDMLEMQDVTEEILVGCVIWACRYIVEFMGTYDAIKAFLDTLERFFVLMKERGVLMSVLAPHLAAKTLLNEDGTVAIVTYHGQLQKGEEEWETWVGPPPEGNIFLHAGVGLEEIMGEINMFFQTSRFTPDLDRAMRLYRHASAWTLKDRKKRTSGKASGITFFLIIGPWIRPIRPFHFCRTQRHTLRNPCL